MAVLFEANASDTPNAVSCICRAPGRMSDATTQFSHKIITFQSRLVVEQPPCLRRRLYRYLVDSVHAECDMSNIAPLCLVL
jgi:hypothetical protein